jgi:hypothetical protein
MTISYMIIERLAEKGLISKYGEARGKAIYFLLFGGYGLQGIVDVGEIVYRANEMNNNSISKELTEDMVAELATTMLSEILVRISTAAGIKTIEALENPLVFFNVLFSTENIGNGELPIEIRKNINESPKSEKEYPPSQTESPDKKEPDNSTNLITPEGVDNNSAIVNSEEEIIEEKYKKPNDIDKKEFMPEKEKETVNKSEPVAIEEEESEMEVTEINIKTDTRKPLSPHNIGDDNKVIADPIEEKPKKERPDKEESKPQKPEKPDKSDANDPKWDAKSKKYDNP